MPDNAENRIQDLLCRNGALSIALDECVARLAAFDGNEARNELQALRDALVRRMKDAETPPDRDLDQARLVGPMIDAVKTIFDDAIERLNDRDGSRIP